MKKTLLLLSIIVLGALINSAQSIKIGAHTKGKNTVSKTTELQHNEVQKVSTDNKLHVLRNNIVLNNKNIRASKMQSQQKIDCRNYNRINTFKSKTPLLKLKASVDTTFHEGFESYNGTAKNWIPSNWTEINKTSNVYVATNSYNSTWAVSAKNTYTAPTEGKSMAWVDWDENYKPQDEWLISPAFTPVAGDIVSFDFFYNPFDMYYDNVASTNTVNVFNFTKPNATLQMHISIDNGTNWTKVWDAKDDASQFNSTNILSFEKTSGMWNTILKTLDTYVGKSIKIAFSYVGVNGGSMGLDNISIRQQMPTAFYMRPQGYFYAGLTPIFKGIDVDLMVGHAYQDATWYNYSNAESKSFSWTFEDPKNATATITSTDVHPTVFYPAGEYKIPTLKAIADNKESTYSWGKANTSYFMAGGQPTTNFGLLGLGNYDLSAGFENPKFATNNYCFGTGPNHAVDAIANYFDKPVHKYLLDSVWINLGKFAAPAGTQFKLIIHKVAADGSLADTIATSVCLAQDVTEPKTGYFTMPFKGFVSIDSITGLEVINDYLEISDAILVELTGFNIPNVTLAALSQVIDTSNGESNAYVFYNYNSQRYLLGGSDYIGATSLLFNLGATYSYIAADSDEFVVPNEGGSKTFNIDTWYSPSDWWSDVELPSWITMDNTFNETTRATTITLKAEALPIGVTGRGATIKVSTYGADMSINVKQGNYTGLPTNKATHTKVISRDNEFELSYTSDYTSVEMYNVAGQIIGIYKLPSTGKLIVPSNTMNRGIYIFKFAGKNTETAKALR